MAVADVVAELLYDFVPWFIPIIIINAAAILKPAKGRTRVVWNVVSSALETVVPEMASILKKTCILS